MINHHENAASSQNLLIKTGRKTNYILKASQIKEELNSLLSKFRDKNQPILSQKISLNTISLKKNLNIK